MGSTAIIDILIQEIEAAERRGVSRYELARLTGWNVVNAGISGDTSAGALERLPALLQEHQPRLVVVSIGGNDFLRRMPVADTRSNASFRLW